MTGNEARRLFLEYFEKAGHQVVRSSSLVPLDDPTLLFTNAGMVQFKRLFIGEEKRNYTRVATSQKCVRAGGKHNDLENVGYTARHHTFFEMLGNFSFGDYFKEKAVELAWDLILNGYKLPEDKLWVSIFLDDDEAFGLWSKNIGVSEDRIVRMGEKDNFWAMGDTGPCGPCSEIHIDRGESFGCGKPDCKVGCDCDRYLEIWNLVFMQFNRNENGDMTPLPSPSIDTGMGLERIVSIVQDVPNNYGTDLFHPIIQKVEALSEKQLGENHEQDVAMKVIADHSRAATFLIGDGVLPANEGRGYVLRRIMRRAIRYGRNIGLVKPFLHETSSIVMDIMEPAYPELKEATSFITKVIKNEEVRFSETLDNGLKILNETLSEIRAKGDNVIPGDVIFKLYDTYGFPVDIVRDVVRDEELVLDMEGFNQRMSKQRTQSRSTTEFSAISDAYRKLSSKGIKTEFSGYDTISCSSKVLLMVKNNDEVKVAKEGDIVEIVTEKTPFYGETGGQVGDIGKIFSKEGEADVTDTVKDPTGIFIHRGRVISGCIKTSDIVTLEVDREKRVSTALNHTATHILHAALRQVLGDHVKQSGSLVSPERLRFDFTHFSKVEKTDLDTIETIVNKKIRENISVACEEMDAEDAFKTNATALFDEKYGDRIRVVSIDTFSSEFCGGTHTGCTGNIGLFKIVSESSIAAGVRRIEALTGAQALEYIQNIDRVVNAAAGLVKEHPEALTEKVKKIIAEQKALEKEVERLKAKIATVAAGAADDYHTINGIKVLIKKVEIDKPAALRDFADKFRDRIKTGIVVLGAKTGSKALLITVVTKDLTDRFHAGDLVKQIAAEVGGGGGGRPDMAQAGGSKPENLDKALENAVGIIEKTALN